MGFIKNHLVIVVGVFTLLIVGAGMYLAKTIIEQNEELIEEIQQKRGTLENFYRQGDDAPSPAKVGKLEEERLALESNLNDLVSRFAVLPGPRLPEREMFPRLYYKETIVFFLDDLYEQARRAGIGIPDNLGIPDGLPESTDQIHLTFARLDTMKRIMEQVFAARLDRIDSLVVENPSQGTNYDTVEIKLTVTGERSRLALFFEFLGSSQAIFVLDNVESFDIDGSRATTSLLLKRVILKS